MNLGGWHYYYPHFTVEETETQTFKETVIITQLRDGSSRTPTKADWLESTCYTKW